MYIELVGKHDCTKIMTVTTEVRAFSESYIDCLKRSSQHVKQKRLTDYHIYTWERFHKQLMPACTRWA